MTTTAVVIDHEKAWKVNADRFGFCNALDLATTKNTPEAWAALEQFGMKRVAEVRPTEAIKAEQEARK